MTQLQATCTDPLPDPQQDVVADIYHNVMQLQQQV